MKRKILILIALVAFGINNIYAQSYYDKKVEEYRKVIEYESQHSNRKKAASISDEALSAGYKHPLFYTTIIMSIIDSDRKQAEKVTRLGLEEYPQDSGLGTLLFLIVTAGYDAEPACEKTKNEFLKYPQNPVLALKLAKFAEIIDKDATKAAKYYKKAIEDGIEDFDAFYNYGIFLYNQTAALAGKYSKEINTNLMEHAKFEELVEQWRKMIPYFEKALELEPGNESATSLHGQLYSRVTQYDLKNPAIPPSYLSDGCKIIINNESEGDLKFAINAEVDGKRELFVYNINPYEKAFLFTTKNSTVYYYASREFPNGFKKKEIKGKDLIEKFNNQYFWLKKSVLTNESIKEGIYTFNISL